MIGIQKASIQGLIVTAFCVISLFAQNLSEEKPAVLFNGKFAQNHTRATTPGLRVSENGSFSCRYIIKNAGDEVRELTQFTFYKNGKPLFNLNEVPGSDMEISNSGIVTFFDTREHYKGILTLHFFNTMGSRLFAKTFSEATLFGFSPAGNLYGVGSQDKFELFSLQSGKSTVFPPALKFDISADETMLVLTGEKNIRVYKNNRPIGSIDHDLMYIRKIRISPDNRIVACIGKKSLFVYSLTNSKLLFSDAAGKNNSFTDLHLTRSVLWAGIHHRDRVNRQSKGILNTYNLSGTLLSQEIQTIKQYAPLRKLNYDYKKRNEYGHTEVPWPFEPFDKADKTWNSYLQLSSSSDGNNSGAYLHQGLDMDVPSYAECYAVADGFVKAVLSTGGELYWRAAISDIETSGTSDAWLYAHLVQSSITVDVGDEVKQGDLVGTIIPWNGLPGGHLHFSRVQSSGNTWSSWRNVANPALFLRPHDDDIPPEIRNVYDDSKFGFTTNDDASNITTLDADDLSGEIDILVKVRDICGESPWAQPATTIFYWIKDLYYNKIVFPRKLAFWRGRDMPDYSGSLYYSLPTVIWRVNSEFPVKGWFTKERLHVHVITNSDGDSIVTEDEKELAFDTEEYGDGDYRIFVEVHDAAGNTTIDSQDVVFKNGITKVKDQNQQQVTKFLINGISSENLNGLHRINFQVPEAAVVSLNILDAQGNTLRTIQKGTFQAGRHNIVWNGTNNAGRKVRSGVYLFVLKAGGGYSSVKKMVYCK